jgi:hypothetical protein
VHLKTTLTYVPSCKAAGVLLICPAARARVASPHLTARYELFPRVPTGELHGESPAITFTIKKMNSNSLLNLLKVVLTYLDVSGLAPDFTRLKEEIDRGIGSTE